MNKYFANQKELLTVASIIFAEVEWNDDIIMLCESIRAIVKVGVNRLKNPVRFKCDKGKDKYTLYDIFTAKDPFSCYPTSKQFKKAQNGLIVDKLEFRMWMEIIVYRDWETDRKSTRLNSSHSGESRMPSSA